MNERRSAFVAPRILRRSAGEYRDFHVPDFVTSVTPLTDVTQLGSGIEESSGMWFRELFPFHSFPEGIESLGRAKLELGSPMKPRSGAGREGGPWAKKRQRPLPVRAEALCVSVVVCSCGGHVAGGFTSIGR